MTTCVLNDSCHLNKSNNNQSILNILNGLKKNINNNTVTNSVNFNNSISNITNSYSNLKNNRKYVSLDLFKVETFLTNGYEKLETEMTKKGTEKFKQDIAELLLYPIYLEYKEMVDYVKSSSNEISYINRWNSLKQIRKLQLIISRIYSTTILKQYYLEDYIVTRSTCGRRCKLNPQPRTPILLFDKVYLNEKYLEKLGNPFPNFIDLRVSNEEDLNDPKSMYRNTPLGKLACSTFLKGQTKIQGMLGLKNSPPYNSCKVEIGATIKRGSGKKSVTKKTSTKKTSTKKTTTKKPTTKKTTTKKTTTKKPTTKKTTTKKTTTKKPTTKKTVVKKKTTKK